MDAVKKQYAACCRLRASLGFGVHSPYVFALLNDVLRESRPYYAYASLEQLPAQQDWGTCPDRTGRLLFRLANALQPANIVEVGTGDGRSMAYLAAARRNIPCLTLDNRPEHEARLRTFFSTVPGVDYRVGETSTALAQALQQIGTVGILHVAQTEAYAQTVEIARSHLSDSTLWIIGNLRASAEKYRWWQSLVADGHTTLTIDLYDVGLVFFDPCRTKRNYKFTF